MFVVNFKVLVFLWVFCFHFAAPNTNTNAFILEQLPCDTSIWNKLCLMLQVHYIDHTVASNAEHSGNLVSEKL